MSDTPDARPSEGTSEGSITPQAIARHMATLIHNEDYPGFAVDETDVGESRVEAGTIRVSGYLHDDPDGTSLVEFVVRIECVEVSR